ncbi:hypothetical protein MPH_04706 [Macrophomina phaseolina MS6]|uniref:Uncharacterized protein n=1 Tax=Macrophomina phaseolina (strain MS6) TaxID=1126212 RepID=K2R6N7_MACPH|nr:hypothetical protein MPH_04706 [Macrophomina phaseolina MS6]
MMLQSQPAKESRSHTSSTYVPFSNLRLRAEINTRCYIPIQVGASIPRCGRVMLKPPQLGEGEWGRPKTSHAALVSMTWALGALAKAWPTDTALGFSGHVSKAVNGHERYPGSIPEHLLWRPVISSVTLRLGSCKESVDASFQLCLFISFTTPLK